MTSSKDFMDEDERRRWAARVPSFGRPLKFTSEMWAKVKLTKPKRRKKPKRK